MSIDIKSDKYVYLRYYDKDGTRINLYLGKMTSTTKFEEKKESVLKAAKYFYKTGLQNYRIGEMLESDPLKAIRVLTKKESIDESELEGSLPSSKIKKRKPQEGPNN